MAGSRVLVPTVTAGQLLRVVSMRIDRRITRLTSTSHTMAISVIRMMTTGRTDALSVASRNNVLLWNKLKTALLSHRRAVLCNIYAIGLSNEVGHHRLLLHRIRDTSGAACLDTFEQPCHVAAELAHHLHTLFVLKNLLRSASVDHIPVFR